MIFAPFAINSLNASGKAKSQQISNPTFPIGVSNTSCASCVELVKCSRSGPQRFFLTYLPEMLPWWSMKYAALRSLSASLEADGWDSTIVPGTIPMKASDH